MADHSSSINKPTGIPRLSKLPVLSKRSSQLFSAHDVVEQAPTTSRLAKRSSIASLPQQKREPLPRPAAASLRSSTIHRNSTAPRLATKTVPSRTQATAGSTQAPSWSPVDGHDGDCLSSLSSFRSASRQGSHDDDSPTDPEAHALPVVKPRGPRPSLSDRAIESIHAVPATPKERRQSSFFSQVDSPMAPPPRPSSVLSSRSDRPGTSDGTSSRPAAPTTSRISMSAKPVSRTSKIGDAKRGGGDTLSARLQNAREPVRRAPRPTSPIKATGRSSKTVNVKDAPDEAGLSSGKDTKQLPPVGIKSSAALRQQIAAARVAAKKGGEQAGPGASQSVEDGPFDVDSHADPFNLTPRDDKHVLRNRIRTARMDGKLNISALGLKAIPHEVLSMYSPAAVQESNTNWAEMVDLTKFIAADNEIDTIEDAIFPDLTHEELMLEENEQSAQFGGIELLDLHGNTLSTIPRGIRRLERLTVLNLTHNRIENGALDIIAQAKTLKELRLGHNSISGNLPVALCGLKHLEVLDVQSNRLLALPEAISELTALRILNVSGNQLTTLPMDAIARLSLQELDASSNALIASLFPLGGPSQHKALKVLNVANNSLAALTFSPELDLPELRNLDVTNNHLAVLPPMKSWQKLVTLTAGDNKIPELPEGFTSLRNLRIANLSGNELHVLPAEVALMESLTTLVLASNPLRHKKYLTMCAADIKQDLRALQRNRSDLSPDEHDDDVASGNTTPEDANAGTNWTIKAGGVLDLSGNGLTDAINDTLGSFLRTNEVRQLKLNNNKLTAVPPALWLAHDLRGLDLSNNPLDDDYLSDELTLPMLSELDLSTCRVAVIEPLLHHLRAPDMQSMQLSGNRISGTVPELRKSFPRLTTLLASDNKFTSVSVEALRGFTIVDLTANDLQSLPAELGLLWDEGLRSFEVGRNAFRVPGHRVLEKGTQATMRWLKDRIKTVAEDEASEVS